LHLLHALTIAHACGVATLKAFGGTIHVEGYFPALTVIGKNAFQGNIEGVITTNTYSANGMASTITFRRGSLPVLVAIEAHAFGWFPGTITITDLAFPRLRAWLPLFSSSLALLVVSSPDQHMRGISLSLVESIIRQPVCSLFWNIMLCSPRNPNSYRNPNV
jgi:hypothetical protein